MIFTMPTTLDEENDPKPGDLITIAGMTGIGKTAFLLNIAQALSTRGEQVDFFAFAHSEKELKFRLGAMMGGSNRRDEYEADKVAKARVDDLNIRFFDAHDMDINFIENRANGIPIIDGINHLEDFNTSCGRAEELPSICRRLKRLARRLQTPIFQSAILSDYTASRKNHYFPMKGASIKESSYIKDFSDAVVYLHREEFFVELERPADDNAVAVMHWQELMSDLQQKGMAFVVRGKHWSTLGMVRDQEGWAKDISHHIF